MKYLTIRNGKFTLRFTRRANLQKMNEKYNESFTTFFPFHNHVNEYLILVVKWFNVLTTPNEGGSNYFLESHTPLPSNMFVNAKLFY